MLLVKVFKVVIKRFTYKIESPEKLLVQVNKTTTK